MLHQAARTGGGCFTGVRLISSSTMARGKFRRCGCLRVCSCMLTCLLPPLHHNVQNIYSLYYAKRKRSSQQRWDHNARERARLPQLLRMFCVTPGHLSLFLSMAPLGAIMRVWFKLKSRDVKNVEMECSFWCSRFASATQIFHEMAKRECIEVSPFKVSRTWIGGTA